MVRNLSSIFIMVVQLCFTCQVCLFGHTDCGNLPMQVLRRGGGGTLKLVAAGAQQAVVGERHGDTLL